MEPIKLVPALVAAAVFLLTYVGILSERIHRTLASVIGAAAMVAAGTWLGFYRDTQAFESIDFNTVTLLFGMMILVGLLEKTGLFAYLVVKVGRLTRGNPALVLVTLGLLTAGLSAVLDNVTTMIVVAPVTISIAGVLGIRAVPLLLSEVILSNIGRVATLIGDPPNILIASAARLSFNDVLVHLAPIALMAVVIVLPVLLVLFRQQLRAGRSNPDVARTLDAKAGWTDPRRARRVLIVLGGTITLYLLHGTLHIGPGLVALMGAAAALLWVRPPVEELIRSVHWDVLVFFIGLFVIVGGLSSVGLLSLVANAIGALTAHGMLLTAIVLLWASAILSAIVDNIPFTMAMIPVLLTLAARGIEVGPLCWALAIGVGFGGNGTPIGSSAGVVTLSAAEQGGTPISVREWLRVGIPATLVGCVIGSAGIVLGIHLGFF